MIRLLLITVRTKLFIKYLRTAAGVCVMLLSSVLVISAVSSCNVSANELPTVLISLVFNSSRPTLGPTWVLEGPPWGSPHNNSDYC